MTDALGDHDAVGLAGLVRSGEVKPLELVDAAIARIETVDTQLNAVIHRRFERARADARQLHLAPPGNRPRPGPLAGVPFLVKDITCHQAGEPFHEGMRFLRDRGWKATSDTHLAARFRAAGLITVGRTNAPELGIVPTTEPLAYGPTRNPWDRSRSPGGSSGGSAAAVAAGLVPAAHANDGGGSIRIPASACGLVGLKPSRGRASLGPDASFTALVVCEHVVCRTVRDSAAFLDVIAGPMPGDPYIAPAPTRPFRDEVGADPGRLRIGLMTAAPGGLAVVAPECVVAAQRTSEVLESLGHHVEFAHPAALDLPDWSAHFISLWSAGVALGLDGWSARVGAVIGADDVEPLTWALAEMARALPTPVAAAFARLAAAHHPAGGRMVGTARWGAGVRPVAHADAGRTARPPRDVRLPARQSPGRPHASGVLHAVHPAVQRDRPAGDLAARAPRPARACRSACSSWPPTAGRTCSCASPPSSKTPTPGPTAARRSASAASTSGREVSGIRDAALATR